MTIDNTPTHRDDLPASYDETLKRLAAEVRSANIRAVRKVNVELINLYWSLGHIILERQAAEGWGTKVIMRLSADLRRQFPHMRGLSPRNLQYMQQFASDFPGPIAQQPAAQLPWGHVMVLLDLSEDAVVRKFYATGAVKEGWSRAVLLNQIKSRLHLRAGAAPSNFSLVLPPAESDLMQQMVKDPYNFEFLTLASDAAERDVETGLVANLAKTLQELGVGFYYAGRQHRLVLTGDHGEEQEFFLDLLFYHHYLRRFVVFELKIDEFKPEYAGKLNFYCNVVDDQLRHADGLDAPTIGILLCASKSNVVVDYSLRNLTTPLAVAQYTYSELPQEFQEVLPSPADLEPIATEAIEEAEAASEQQ
ncbi:MAG TPA: PDDEXK nuclease domain-containing protein [Acidimicrobiales bacterium]